MTRRYATESEEPQAEATTEAPAEPTDEEKAAQAKAALLEGADNHELAAVLTLRRKEALEKLTTEEIVAELKKRGAKVNLTGT